jgi:acyl carrier protein
MAKRYNESKILEGLKDIIVTAMRTDREKIHSDSRIFSDLGAESLDVLDIRFRIEEMFGLKISDGEVIRQLGENLTAQEIDNKFTVKSLLEYVQNRLNENKEI